MLSGFKNHAYDRAAAEFLDNTSTKIANEMVIENPRFNQETEKLLEGFSHGWEKDHTSILVKFLKGTSGLFVAKLMEDQYLRRFVSIEDAELLINVNGDLVFIQWLANFLLGPVPYLQFSCFVTRQNSELLWSESDALSKCKKKCETGILDTTVVVSVFHGRPLEIQDLIGDGFFITTPEEKDEIRSLLDGLLLFFLTLSVGI